MEMSEFLERNRLSETAVEEPSEACAEELDVQKAVVESLAADKAEQDERILSLNAENVALRQERDALSRELSIQKGEVAALKAKIDEMRASLEKVGDVLAANQEGKESSQIALLDRDPEVNDRFGGETRDHVLEVLREARDEAERQGRNRRAQLLESVLVANEPSGNLQKKRAALKKYFAENGNILSGPVIAELERCGISYKNGEEYLLAEEILKRMY